MAPYRIVLADDHVLLRQGVRKIIEAVGDLEVIGEASDGLELLSLLRRVSPQLVLLDISMPHLRGIEAIREIRAVHPGVKILMLTMHKDRTYLVEALRAGADGYLLKEDADQQLFAAIQKIRQGKSYVSPKLSDDMAETWAQTLRGDTGLAPHADPLTLRERQILKLTAEGRSSKEIAEDLCISHRTVEHHRANITSKLRLKGTAELVRYALSKGYI